MHLSTHLAGQRLARLRERARSSAVRERRRMRVYAAAPRIDAASVTDVPAEDAPLVLDRRRSARDAMRGCDIRVRRIGGFSFQVGLKDLSTDGCRIELIEECEPGEDVIARFPQLEPLGAQIRWTIGTSAGVEFVRPIHPAVFKFLLARLGEEASAA